MHRPSRYSETCFSRSVDIYAAYTKCNPTHPSIRKLLHPRHSTTICGITVRHNKSGRLPQTRPLTLRNPARHTTSSPCQPIAPPPSERFTIKRKPLPLQQPTPLETFTLDTNQPLQVYPTTPMPTALPPPIAPHALTLATTCSPAAPELEFEREAGVSEGGDEAGENEGAIGVTRT